MKIIFCGFLLFFGFSSQTKPAILNSVSPNPAAQKALRKILKIYHLKAMQIKMEQEIFLSAIKTRVKSHGTLNIQVEKFHLNLQGEPSSLMLFDGDTLWYQADTSEKVVFQLKSPSHIQILTSFFDEERFFEFFLIKQAKKTKQDYVFQLQPKKEIEGLSDIFVKAGSHISEIRLIWKELNNWQKYKFSKPRGKELPGRLFQFSTSGFRVITKD